MYYDIDGIVEEMDNELKTILKTYCMSDLFDESFKIKIIVECRVFLSMP